MEFRCGSIKVIELIDLKKTDRLVLSPPYQRNPIWSRPAQKELISTILRGWPLPNLFLLEKNGGQLEVVDGQQRIRAILDFVGGRLKGSDGEEFEDNNFESTELRERFLKYPISTVFISSLNESESIEKFYSLVNSAGRRLNRPELAKAEYHNTEFLRLIQELADDDSPFGQLGLFTGASKARMNHVDFMGELVALFKFGESDKKDKVDDLFEEDITSDEASQLSCVANSVFKKISDASGDVPIARTRFRQKNDFYTLSGFVKDCIDQNIPDEAIGYFVRVFVKLSKLIRPSQEDCDVLRDYARNCVTQSNSKAARDFRKRVFLDLFLNKERTPNKSQRDILDYHELSEDALVPVAGEHFTFDEERLRDPRKLELF